MILFVQSRPIPKLLHTPIPDDLLIELLDNILGAISTTIDDHFYLKEFEGLSKFRIMTILEREDWTKMVSNDWHIYTLEDLKCRFFKYINNYILNVKHTKVKIIKLLRLNII